MTNQEYMAGLRPDDCWAVMDWLLHEFGLWHHSPRLAVISWLQAEAAIGEWEHVHGVVTAGGDPAYRCPKCGKGYHVYGIEHLKDRRAFCPDCGHWNIYPYGG